MPSLDRDRLVRRDLDDPLGGLREAFVLPAGVIYLDGNSLGPLPKASRAHLEAVVARQWGEDLIRSWNTHGWIDAPARVGARIAPLIGARPTEVVVADSTTVNLFKLVSGALALKRRPAVILAEAGNFPTDLHVLEGLAAASGGAVTLRVIPRERVLEALDGSVDLLVLTHVHYRTAERWPLAEVTALARARGALTLWDLSHSAGALAVDLNGAGADFAVGCGYKYLNGGPGAPAFAFVAERWQAQLASPIWGWMGHAAPFDFADRFAPASGMARQLAGTPPILALAALEASLSVFEGVDTAALEAKAQALAEVFIALVETRCAGQGLERVTPGDPARRGAHVAYDHPCAYALMQALIARGLVGDFRAPATVRFGLAPLYTRFQDLWDAVEILEGVLARREHEAERFQRRLAVT